MASWGLVLRSPRTRGGEPLRLVGRVRVDICVVMFGVAGGFGDNEMKATAAMLNRMITRNPKARLYVLLSPPLFISDKRSKTVL